MRRPLSRHVVRRLKAMRQSPRLRAARRDRLLVQFTRPFESGSVNGYILGVGPRFCLVAIVEEASRFNGFQCFRLSDVRELQVPHKYAAFAEAVLKRRGKRIPRTPRVSLASIKALLISASRRFPLVTIHRERIDPDVCEIGRVLHVRNGRVSLLEINPDASWDYEPTEYRLADITRVDFGGEYEDSLHLIGGAPSNHRLEQTGT